ncbi:MAG: hypothetical protein M3416_07255 [Acidobacteriota bacterium]|nr:hypothetical protein [Acidobacteriota bacterium]
MKDMNPAKLSLDVKSFIIGLLTAALVFVLASGRPGQAQNAGAQFSISAVDDGVYILNSGSVYFMERGRCRPHCQ